MYIQLVTRRLSQATYIANNIAITNVILFLELCMLITGEGWGGSLWLPIPGLGHMDSSSWPFLSFFGPTWSSNFTPPSPLLVCPTFLLLGMVTQYIWSSWNNPSACSRLASSGTSNASSKLKYLCGVTSRLPRTTRCPYLSTCKVMSVDAKPWWSCYKEWDICYKNFNRKRLYMINKKLFYIYICLDSNPNQYHFKYSSYFRISNELDICISF